MSSALYVKTNPPSNSLLAFKNKVLEPCNNDISEISLRAIVKIRIKYILGTKQ